MDAWRGVCFGRHVGAARGVRPCISGQRCGACAHVHDIMCMRQRLRAWEISKLQHVPLRLVTVLRACVLCCQQHWFDVQMLLAPVSVCVLVEPTVLAATPLVYRVAPGT